MKEITEPLKSPLKGWRRPATQKPSRKKAPTLYDDPTVHELMNYLRERLGSELDGEFRANYSACKELVRRCNEKGTDPVGVLKTLVDVALQDPHHGKNATNWRYLLNWAVAIFRSYKARFTQPASKFDQAIRKYDDGLARQRAGHEPHHTVRDPSQSSRDQEVDG